MESLETCGDVYMGSPEADALSDGDSDDSDDEASGSSVHLTRRLLEKSAEVMVNVDPLDTNDQQSNSTTALESSLKCMCARKW